MHHPDPPTPATTLRSALRPGDLGAVLTLHGALYGREHGFDHRFEAYVAVPLAQLALAHSPRERIWLAERGDRLVGCIAIAAASAEVAQLRWFVVDPVARGTGLGRRLIGEAIAFARAQGYRSIVLWTVDRLHAAAHLYRGAGFAKTEEQAGSPWGVSLVEEKYELFLD